MQGGTSPLDLTQVILSDSAVLEIPSTPVSSIVMVGTVCQDADGDGYGALGNAACPQGIAPDCDDTEGNTHPGATEINDGLDNQCLGDPGFGLIDEISGTAGFFNPGNDTELSWPEQSRATLYEVFQSRFASLCPEGSPVLTTDATGFIPDTPTPGEPLYYVVRAALPNLGSLGQSSVGIERIFPCEAVCDDGLDNDSDGLTDCDGSDCAQTPSCRPAIFTFQDTVGDELSDTELSDYFSALPSDPNDYILFEISRPAGEFAWCAERADFYRDSYLAFAISGADINSGSWEKWRRSPGTGDTWQSRGTGGRRNRFGADCGEQYSWCSENVGGSWRLSVRPARTDD